MRGRKNESLEKVRVVKYQLFPLPLSAPAPYFAPFFYGEKLMSYKDN